VLIVDDVLFFPVSGILWVFNKVYEAARQELAGQADAITAELSELYTMLETEKISTDEFDAREKELLDRLDDLEEQTVVIED
jgi:hypothetical protein